MRLRAVGEHQLGGAWLRRTDDRDQFHLTGLDFSAICPGDGHRQPPVMRWPIARSFWINVRRANLLDMNQAARTELIVFLEQVGANLAIDVDIRDLRFRAPSHWDNGDERGQTGPSDNRGHRATSGKRAPRSRGKQRATSNTRGTGVGHPALDLHGVPGKGVSFSPKRMSCPLLTVK